MKERFREHSFYFLFIAGAVSVVAVVWWLHWRQFETTRDALVDGYIHGIAARIAGTVTGVPVDENQFVKAGQVLVDLDPQDRAVLIPAAETPRRMDYSTALSAVSAARAGLSAAERNYEAAQSKVRESEANDASTIAASRESAEAARRQVDQSREQLAQAEQLAEEARHAAPSEIELWRSSVATQDHFSDSKIVSPVTGIIAVRIAAVGQHVTPGQQVMLVTEIGNLWVTAKYNQTQIRRMRPGQGVRIHVGALATTFDGYVESMPAVGGVAVRIRFKKDQPGLDRLRPGMSVEPKTRV
jgi:membrane fusion protein (multidrug efflux system)